MDPPEVPLLQSGNALRYCCEWTVTWLRCGSCVPKASLVHDNRTWTETEEEETKGRPEDVASRHEVPQRAGTVVEVRPSTTEHTCRWTFHHSSGREGPSLEVSQPSHPHSRNPIDPKFEDLCQEERRRSKSDGPAEQNGTWQMKCAKFEETWIKTGPWSSRFRRVALVFSHFFDWCLLAPSTIEPEARESVVDSGASMHMLSRKMKIQQNWKRCIQKLHNGHHSQQTNEGATRDLDLFLTVQLFEDTPPTIFRGHLREDRTLATDIIGENMLSEVVDIVERGNATLKIIKCCIFYCVGKLSWAIVCLLTHGCCWLCSCSLCRSEAQSFPKTISCSQHLPTLDAMIRNDWSARRRSMIGPVVPVTEEGFFWTHCGYVLPTMISCGAAAAHKGPRRASPTPWKNMVRWNGTEKRWPLVTPTTKGGGLFGVWMKYVFGLKKSLWVSEFHLAAQEQKNEKLQYDIQVPCVWHCCSQHQQNRISASRRMVARESICKKNNGPRPQSCHRMFLQVQM